MLSLNGFTVSPAIHRGRSIVVYRAVRDADGVRVAIKTHVHEDPGPRALGALRHEHAILSGLSIEGVPRPLGLERRERGLALILEEIPGQDLATRIAAGPLELREALRIASALAGILDKVHAAGVVHKDIEPHNVLVQDDPFAVHLVDFGMATRLLHETQGAQRPEALEGTLAYMSPEQTGRTNRTIDARSDLYALGCVLYEMLTRERPFGTTDPVELVHAHVARRPRSPDECVPGLPRPIAAITMKLLAKAPEDRYQTAAGLRADLMRCLAELSEKGTVDDFTLGLRDRWTSLRLPEKLYGRGADRSRLLAALGRAAGGAAELFLITGPAGVGKSVLVHELSGPLARSGGRIAEGKFDQRSRGVPLAPITEALRRLLLALSTERADVLSRTRTRVAAALGPSAPVLFDLLPELAALLGPAPRSPDLGPAESRNRFHLAVQRLLRALGEPERPFVLFLDDLQWADPASLELLRVILTDEERGHLLLVGAYRDNEVVAGHPLLPTLEGLARAGVPITTIDLRPLDGDDVTALLSDALAQPADEVLPLARVVHEKTHNNPFFVRQFLEMLAQEKHIYFDTASGRWTYDLEAIAARDVTDNVVTFMVDRIGKLPIETQEVLRLAACIGHAFDLSTLSTICAWSPGRTARALWPALSQGLVIPLDPSYRLAHPDEEEDPELDTLEIDVPYRFLHDRVQQAAYATISADERRATHLGIGRLLLSSMATEALEDRLFDVVDHLNDGAPLMTSPDERSRLAELDLLAGRKAKAGAAYAAAAGYFRAGLGLLDEDAFRTAYPLAFSLHVGAAECEYLSGHFDEAEALFSTALSSARDDVDRAIIDALRLKLYQVAGRYDAGVSLGYSALARFGMHFPEDDAAVEAAMGEELAGIREAMRGRTIPDLCDAPLLVDERARAIIELLEGTAPCAYIGRPSAFPLITLRMVRLSLTHGNTEAACFGYSIYGLMLVSVFGDIDAGYQFSEMSIRLNERLGDVKLRGTLLHLHGDHIHFWKNPFRTGIPILERAFSACLEAGDLVYASYLAFETPWQLYEKGDPLEDVLLATERYATFARGIKNEAVFDTIQLEQRFLERLRGKDGEPFDEEACIERIAAASFGCGLAFHRVMRLVWSYLEGDPRAALDEAAAVRPVEGAIMAMPIEATYHHYRALAHLGCAEQATGEERRAALDEAGRAIEKLTRWAASCPENFEHRRLLLLAESARVSGEHDRAADLFEQAVETARRAGIVQEEALACLRAGSFAVARGRRRVAAIYLAAARDLYAAWGAHALVARLVEEWPDLVQGGSPVSVAAPALPLPEESCTTASAVFDVQALLGAMEAIAGEIALDRALSRVIRAVLMSAGARRASLLLEREGELMVAATMTVDPDVTRVGLMVPLAACPDVVEAVVRRAARTRQPVTVGDALRDARLSLDPCVQARKPRSILCLPLEHQARLIGAIYLEHDQAPDVFTAGRTALLSLIGSQIATTVQNALLYEDVRRTTDELQNANQTLEAEVQRRTAELFEANEKLSQELTERRRAEEARAALQEEIIRVQRERLRELSTPLMPITPSIAVIPLVGTMDRERAEGVTKAALDAVRDRGAERVILDVTGVPNFDTSVARALVDTASALRLLGAEAILTGIRADAARTLVTMGLDLGNIATRATLQSGFVYALARSGEGWLGARPRA
jgi:predicted ATPase/anti-anti-sigma regulatory factor